MSEAQITGPEPTATGTPTPALPTPGEGAPTPQTVLATEATPPAQPAAPAPEAEIVYEFKPPEGMEFAQGDLDEFKSIAKDLKLPNEQAQRIVDLAAKREQAKAAALDQEKAAWAAQTKADKELGTPENLALARKAYETFGSPELEELFFKTGLGNHPVVVRAFLRAGRHLSEDSIVGAGAGGGASARSTADILYGSSPTH